MPVVTALEFHNVLALGVSTRKTDGRHGCFGSGTYEANFLHGRKRSQHQLRQIGFGWRRSSKTRAIARSADDGVEHVRRGMPKNQRSPGPNVVDVFIFIGVPDMRSLATHNKRRIAADRSKCAHRRVHSAGYHALGSLLQTARLLDFSRCCGGHQVLPQKKTDYYSSARAKQINQIFTFSPSSCNMVQVTWFHHVALLTGRVQGQLRGLRAVLTDFKQALRLRDHFR